ncbi:MAG: dephospho-CoA kinase [Gammaproteobacteria bacterium]|nr:dephospho-CoA kinase [Gammaproteobacteria bacterium]MCY4283337.1 dephospho-CoA kinase [Gammaproteobacteria bacterium]MCY4338433.1 dephospho-CoA kinase [Gammaproteobacteria bacterium]
MKRPLRVGLTGGIGSGKSTVKTCFDGLGVPTIDADEISHRITKPGQAAFNEVVALFGAHSLDNAGNLDRRRLRRQVFREPTLKKRLEAIIHPRVREEIQAFIKQIDYAYCVICIPLLLETGAQTTVDRVLVVDAPEALQVARVGLRDNAEEQQTRSIISAQVSREQRLRAAHDIIVNDGNIDAVKTQVERLHEKYRNLI